ncbi:helix-turn-helix domain-containing protein [Cryptosporangium phraense]|uniref:Helix-turn-helix domain-containing protein n=1 Tax=Cryptosporangium phraense TaxID=2593070 RepID=A0A545APA2_9ACTN|nr:helix-turn-helix domain-containing protein [Cryptosporangium phraense]
MRARREATDPVAAGFPAGSRRRTPGLRREELAQLAGVSVTWYTWLEQARDITVSRQVIASLARVLELTAAERAHLYTLAELALPPSDPHPPTVDPTLQRLVDVLQPNPAYLTNPWWDLVAFNDAYASLLGGLEQRPPAERNILWITFTESRGAGLFVDWDSEARSLIGQFRVTLAQHPNDPRGAELLTTLRAADPYFRELWDEHSIGRFESARKRLVHPRAGRVDLDYTKLTAAADDQLFLVVFLPSDDESAAKLRGLAGG